jgi:uncharacterized protein YutE (UPF0331/DUF86 family)
VIDRELVLRKLDLVRHHVARLRAKLPATAEALVGDEDLRDILSNNVCQAVQGAFDVTAHVIAHVEAKVPDTYAEGFELLAGKNVIDAALARNLIRASGLRNRLQHQYQTVDWKVVHASIRDGLGDFDAFVKAIRTFLDAGAGEGRPKR